MIYEAWTCNNRVYFCSTYEFSRVAVIVSLLRLLLVLVCLVCLEAERDDESFVDLVEIARLNETTSSSLFHCASCTSLVHLKNTD